MKASSEIAGISCPYCRFPIKEGGDITACPACRSVHHTDCWDDNLGCAITGCANGPTIGADGTQQPTEAIAAQPTVLRAGSARLPTPSPPPPRPAGRNRNRDALLVVAVIVILILGGAVAFLVGHDSGHAATTTEVVNNATSETSPAAHTTVRSRESEAAATSPPPRTRLALQAYQGSDYSMMIPSGWSQEVNELRRGQEVESKWGSPSAGGEYLRVDVHSPTHLSAEADANPVREGLEKQSSYREMGYESGDLSRSGSWMWVFGDEGDDRIDYFFETCSNTVAVLGSSSPSRFNVLRSTFREVADSFRSTCE